MKIGVDARPLTYRMTGIGVYLKHLLDELQRIDDANQYYLISNGRIRYVLSNTNWHKVEGRCQKRLLSTFWMQCRAPVIASELKLDVFWGPRHHLPLLLPARMKAVLTVHDIVHLVCPGTMPVPHLLVERLLMRWSVSRAVCIIAVSQSTASGIQKAYKVASTKIKTVHSGASAPGGTMHAKPAFSRALPSAYFLFVGTPEPRKNIERIFKAFELMQPEDRKLHLVIAGGPGWKNKAFLDSLRDHPLNQYVWFTGYVETDALSTLYENALCLLFPSLYEGFGLPILEAMACGTPVITSNISSMPEIAGDAALLVDPYDVDALARSMREILTNKKLRKELIAKGFERVKQFSWERCARQTLQVLSSRDER